MIIAKNLREIAKVEEKNYRTVKKVAVEIFKLQKNGKTVRVGYIMPDELLDIKQKLNGED